MAAQEGVTCKSCGEKHILYSPQGGIFEHGIFEYTCPVSHARTRVQLGGEWEKVIYHRPSSAVVVTKVSD